MLEFVIYGIFVRPRAQIEQLRSFEHFGIRVDAENPGHE